MCIRYLMNNSGSIVRDEFDPQKDYKNEYAKVYFRIDTPLYYPRDGKNYVGFTSNQDSDYFYREIRCVLVESGWAGTNTEMGRGKESLYIHPQNVSGIVRKNNIREVAEVLDGSCCSSVSWVDVYDTFFDISDEKCLKILQSKEVAIIKDFLDSAKTKRRNQYYSKQELVRRKAGQNSVKRIGIDQSCGFSDGCEVSRAYVESLLAKLVSQGYMVTARNNEIIRCRNKTELKVLKLPADYDEFIKV